MNGCRVPEDLPGPPEVGPRVAEHLQKAIDLHTLGVEVNLPPAPPPPKKKRSLNLRVFGMFGVPQTLKTLNPKPLNLKP